MTTAHGSSALEHICVLCSECAAAESVDISVLKEIFDTATAALAIGPAPQEDEAVATVTYTNWRGETSTRRIIPKSVRYGSTEWHPEPQWLLLAWDDDKKTDREFALKDFGPAPQPPVEGLRSATPIKQLDWQETFVDRGDGSTEQSGWEADNGFSSWYSVEQYFASDSYGWQVKFDCDVIGDFDNPDQAKVCAQSHFEIRILAALASPSPTAGVDENAVLLRGASLTIADIEKRFPNWESFRDLVDCIDCTLHDLRSAPTTLIEQSGAEVIHRTKHKSTQNI